MIYKIYALKLKDSTEIKYVGRTSESLETRLSKHKTNAKFDKNKTHRHYWILKHYNDIEIVLIEDNIETFEDSCVREIFHITEHRKTYTLINSTNGGDGGCPGYKHTEESKKKIGDAHRGKKLSKEHINFLKNREFTEEHRKNLSDSLKLSMKGEGNPMYGKKRPDTAELNRQRKGVWKMSEEVKKKMSEDRTGKKTGNYKHGRYTKEAKLKKKRIYKITEDDVIKIRELWETGNYTYMEIGDMFNITKSYTSAIIRKIKWKNV